MNIKVYIVHGFEGYPQEGWFPWLKSSLEGMGVSVKIPNLPNAKNPKKEEWIKSLAEAVGTPDENTYFIGHSLGCQCISRYLETLPKEVQTGGALFIAGFFQRLSNMDKSEEEKALTTEWINAPLDFQKVRRHLLQSTAVFSSNDPFVPLSNADDFEKKLGAKIRILQEKGHFSDVKEVPEILNIFGEMIRSPVTPFENFQKIDMRIGRIVSVEDLPNPKHTTHKITIDFGEELGRKISGARLVRYSHEELLGKLVICVINLPQKQIGNIFSEVYTLGLPATDGDECILLAPDKDNAKLGGRVY